MFRSFWWTAASWLIPICSASVDKQQAVLAPKQHTTVNVAVIGAGAAGSSAAYHLSKYANEAGMPINITVFERNSYIGGRSITVNAYNDSRLPLELGASIFVKVNRILVGAAQTFNLSTNSLDAEAAVGNAPSLGIWDGEQFVLKLSSAGPTWWDGIRLLTKYGLSPVRTMASMKTVIGRFLKMYDTPVFPFSSIAQAAQDVELRGVTSTAGVQYLREKGISDQYAHDVIQASTRVNYAQNLHNFHGLETMVCMATDGAMAVEGGNWQIFDRMISASAATMLLNTTVDRLSRTSRQGYKVVTADIATSENLSFDSVVLAMPHQYSGITLDDGIHAPPKIEYVTLHVTLLTSPFLLQPTAFALAAGDLVPRTILTTTRCKGQQACFTDEDSAPAFFSISQLTTFTNPSSGRQEFAYKIFSHSEPTLAWLLSILNDAEAPPDEAITWLYRKVWQSYPVETPTSTFPDIMLDDNLYYTASMEGFISTMETNALMGKNIARLIVDKWMTAELRST